MKNIYIIQNTKNKNIKIGVTSNITKRLSSLQCGSDYKLEVKFLSAPVKNALKIESTIHNEFKRENTHGEWFELNIDKAISKIKETIKLYGKIELLLPGDTKLIREKNRRILKSKADKYFKETFLPDIDVKYIFLSVCQVPFLIFIFASSYNVWIFAGFFYFKHK